MSSPEAVERVLAVVEERGLRHVTIGVFDVNARLRAKRFNVANLRKGLIEGTPFIAGVLANSPAEDLIETNPLVDPKDQFRDGLLLLDAESCRDLPFGDPKSLVIIGQYGEGDEIYCPRARLSLELERIEALGFEAFGGFELEGCVLAETEASVREKVPHTVALQPGYERYCSFDQITGMPLVDEIEAACAAMRIGIDTLHTEYIGQLEAGLSPVRGLQIADDAALYKTIAKTIVRRHDGMITFMARRNSENQGCGAHVNISLRERGSDCAAFYDPEGPDHMGATLRHFLGGLHAHVPELFLLFAPHVNSFKRLQPGLFTPLHNTWGFNNKTVAFRVLTTSPAATRIEVRIPGADINPYLALCAVLIAGRRGIEERLEPPAATVGDGWSLEKSPEPLFPRTFAEAIERFEGSALAREALGDAFVDIFASDRRWEIDQLERTVTDWEVRLLAESV